MEPLPKLPSFRSFSPDASPNHSPRRIQADVRVLTTSDQPLTTGQRTPVGPAPKAKSALTPAHADPKRSILEGSPVAPAGNSRTGGSSAAGSHDLMPGQFMNISPTSLLPDASSPPQTQDSPSTARSPARVATSSVSTTYPQSVRSLVPERKPERKLRESAPFAKQTSSSSDSDSSDDDGKSSWKRYKYGVIFTLVVGGALLTAGTIIGFARGGAGSVSDEAALLKRSVAKLAPNQRRGSFLVIGDWGYDHNVYGRNMATDRCQTIVADKMHEKMEELGDVKFVINLGDSFYPGGVPNKEDWQWQEKWRDIYSSKTRSVPWYSVYGNHDYIFDNCACTDNWEECALVNDNISDLDHFYMPNLTWSKFHPELDLEVVGMDMNLFVEDWWRIISTPQWAYNHDFCQTSEYECHFRCWHSFKQRADASLAHYFERHKNSTAKNMVVFSHFPTDYLAEGVPDFMAGLRDPKFHTEYFGGHRHTVDEWSTVKTYPNHNWVNGGGGGWTCDGPNQGFVVGEIDANYNMITYPVFVPRSVCCR